MQTDQATTSFELSKLQRILRYATEKVPYYRDILRSMGSRPEEILALSDLQRFPLLYKQIIQQQPEKFISDDCKQSSNLVRTYTSGTTGAPLEIIHTRAENILAGRCLMDARIRGGLQLPARWVVLGSVGYFITNNLTSHPTKMGSTRILLLRTLDLSDHILQQHLIEIKAFNPSWIFGSPTVLHTLARYLLSIDDPLELPNLQLIELMGEYVFPEARQLISKAFCRAPLSMYGCQEIWGLAYECLAGGMHVLTENVHLEILGSDGKPVQPGEIGEVVVTGLNFRTMPFIRYRLGDLASPVSETCPCQDKRPLIQIIGGRTCDFIVGYPGRIGSLVFDTLIKYLHKNGYVVRQFRVIQHSISHFEVWIVPITAWDLHAQEMFKTKSQELLGRDAVFDFKIVAAIPISAEGKSRSFVIDMD